MRTTKLNPVLAPFARAVRTGAATRQRRGIAGRCALLAIRRRRTDRCNGWPLGVQDRRRGRHAPDDSQADLKSGPRVTVPVVNSHSNKTETYQGVPLSALLQKAGVPQGERFRGRG